MCRCRHLQRPQPQTLNSRVQLHQQASLLNKDLQKRSQREVVVIPLCRGASVLILYVFVSAGGQMSGRLFVLAVTGYDSGPRSAGQDGTGMERVVMDGSLACV